MNQGRLAGKSIALSVSAPHDIAQCGMGPEHFNDALGEISRQLLALGARLVYGGDLREGGITQVLFELAARYSPSFAQRDQYRPMILDVVPYPMHAELTPEELLAWEAEFATIAELRYMNENANAWSFATRPQRLDQLPNEAWPDAFTAMRQYVTQASDARIVLGGKTAGYLGRMPGVAEEVLISATARQPLFIIGGFGGVAQQIARSVAANEQITVPGAKESYFVEVPNGLDAIGLQRLSISPHIDEVVVLLTRGLSNLFGA
jgi:hypothetical protein